jgi:cytochrome c oxidase subunit 4
MSEDTHEHSSGGSKLYLMVWFGLIGLTAIEVFLGYKQLSLNLMLTILMGLSLVKAVLIIFYFMHLKFEKTALILTILPAMVIVISLLSIFFPDAQRLLEHSANR